MKRTSCCMTTKQQESTCIFLLKRFSVQPYSGLLHGTFRHIFGTILLSTSMNQTPTDRSQPRECGPAAPVAAQASAAQVASAARPKGAKVCVYKMDRGCTHWAYRKCKSCTRPLCRTCLSFFHWPTQSCGRKCKPPDRSRTRWARNVLRPSG